LPAGVCVTGTAGVVLAGWLEPGAGKAGALKVAGLDESGVTCLGLPEFWQEANTKADRAMPKILFMMMEELVN
jgi:hypothetical protein